MFILRLEESEFPVAGRWQGLLLNWKPVITNPENSLSSAEASLYCGEAFVLWGARFLFFFRLLIYWWGYPAGATAEERAENL